MGVVTVRLSISKKFYPTITNFMDHFVTIRANQDGPVEVTSANPLCNSATINTSASQVNDVFHLWGDVVDTVTPAFAEYTYSGVACGDDLIFFYQAEYLNEGIWNVIPETNFPISFDGNTRQFTVTKCGPVSQIGDLDCAGFQYTKIYKMRIKATLSNLIGDTDTTNRFTIIIGPDCTDSTLTVIPSGD